MMVLDVQGKMVSESPEDRSRNADNLCICSVCVLLSLKSNMM